MEELNIKTHTFNLTLEIARSFPLTQEKARLLSPYVERYVSTSEKEQFLDALDKMLSLEKQIIKNCHDVANRTDNDGYRNSLLKSARMHEKKLTRLEQNIIIFGGDVKC